MNLIIASAIACITLLNYGGTLSSRLCLSENPVISYNDNEIETGFLGLTVQNVYVVDENDKKISGSEIALNSSFSIVFEGIKNFTLKKGKASPGLSLRVMDDDENTIINETYLLPHTDGVSEADASVLRATVTARKPIKPGKYICTIQVTDRHNTDAAIASTWSFEVK